MSAVYNTFGENSVALNQGVVNIVTASPKKDSATCGYVLENNVIGCVVPGPNASVTNHITTVTTPCEDCGVGINKPCDDCGAVPTNTEFTGTLSGVEGKWRLCGECAEGISEEEEEEDEKYMETKKDPVAEFHAAVNQNVPTSKDSEPLMTGSCYIPVEEIMQAEIDTPPNPACEEWELQEVIETLPEIFVWKNKNTGKIFETKIKGYFIHHSDEPEEDEVKLLYDKDGKIYGRIDEEGNFSSWWPVSYLKTKEGVRVREVDATGLERTREYPVTNETVDEPTEPEEVATKSRVRKEPEPSAEDKNRETALKFAKVVLEAIVLSENKKTLAVERCAASLERLADAMTVAAGPEWKYRDGSICNKKCWDVVHKAFERLSKNEE